MPATKKTKHEDQFTALAKITTLVADTGDIEAIRRLKPTDATTNPSLLFKAASLAQYEHIVSDAVKYGRDLKDVSDEHRIAITMDRLAVNFGKEITQIVPGYVSTEVDARLSYDTKGTIDRARRIISMYKDVGVDKSRVLIKIASTWEGIRASEVLQKEGVTTNMTLLFGLPQAIAAAEAKATLISPFVGRILDWYKKEQGREFDAEEDPGVLSVRQIYGYYKKFGYETIVMGASFRSKGEIIALAGCDRLTISPNLLDELKTSHDPVPHLLDAKDAAKFYTGDKQHMDERTFRLALNDDPMATAKLAEGIRGFAHDASKLEEVVKKLLVSDNADQYSALAKMTTLVADTGDIEAIRRLKPTDATTNPSLIYKAAGLKQYEPLIEDAIAVGKKLVNGGGDQEKLDMIIDRLCVNFGREITKIVPGYVSTEVDARLSFDAQATIARARRIIHMYKDVGIDKSRILIKIASTWEGIRAAEVLEKEGITCNLTLCFGLAQAIAAADAHATLISPFVGRITDWYSKERKVKFDPEEDPGVLSVRQIYGYFKKYAIKTIVMGASFRSKGQIVALAGCDRLTIAPQLLEELKESREPLPRILNPTTAAANYHGSKQSIDRKAFYLAMMEDAMATDKLAEGIRGFAADIVKLEEVVRKRLASEMQT